MDSYQDLYSQFRDNGSMSLSPVNPKLSFLILRVHAEIHWKGSEIDTRFLDRDSHHPNEMKVHTALVSIDYVTIAGRNDKSTAPTARTTPEDT